MPVFTSLFLAALTLATLGQLWLARRQLRHVLAHREAVPPAFAASISLADHQRAADYTAAKTRAGMVHTVYDAAVVLGLTLGGGLDILSRFWHGTLDSPLFSGAAFAASVAVLLAVLELPFSLHRTFGIEARFGFNKMTPGLFVADLLKQALLSALLGLPLLLLVLWLMERMGGLWWLYAWAAWTGFNLLLVAAWPVFIAPLFNRFEPLRDEALKARITALLARCGFAAEGLYVMDGSRRSGHGNAYFAGFGKGRRIVLFDTLVERLAPEEIEAVLAHELGHFKLRHIPKRLALLFGLSLAFLWLLGQLMTAPWFHAGLGVSTPGTAEALVLFFLALPPFLFPFAPLSSLLSRRHEFEADAYAARQASGADLARALVKLYQDNAATLTPDPLYSAYHDSHPPAAQRIARLQSGGAAP